MLMSLNVSNVALSKQIDVKSEVVHLEVDGESQMKTSGILFLTQHNSNKILILLTVHLVTVLGKWPNWRTILFYVFISILYMFRANSCSSSGESILSIQHLVYVTLCRWPFRVQVGKFLSDLNTKRSPTQSDIYQMWYWYNWFFW